MFNCPFVECFEFKTARLDHRDFLGRYVGQVCIRELVLSNGLMTGLYVN